MSLPKTKTLLEFFEGHPERWTQRTIARDAHGNTTLNRESACAFCLIGAAIHIGIDTSLVFNQCIKRLGTKGSMFNDSCETFDEFMDGLRKLGL
jgi:hypothetical protein